MVSRGQKKKKRATRRAWTKHDERELRTHSKSKSPVKTVVRAMRRTAGALRQKDIRSAGSNMAKAAKRRSKQSSERLRSQGN